MCMSCFLLAASLTCGDALSPYPPREHCQEIEVRFRLRNNEPPHFASGCLIMIFFTHLNAQNDRSVSPFSPFLRVIQIKLDDDCCFEGIIMQRSGSKNQFLNEISLSRTLKMDLKTGQLPCEEESRFLVIYEFP